MPSRIEDEKNKQSARVSVDYGRQHQTADRRAAQASAERANRAQTAAPAKTSAPRQEAPGRRTRRSGPESRTGNGSDLVGNYARQHKTVQSRPAGSIRQSFTGFAAAQEPPEFDPETLAGKSGRYWLAEIGKVGRSDPEEGRKLYGLYEEARADQNSPLYDPYAFATNTNPKYTAKNAAQTEKAKTEWQNLRQELAFWAQSDRNYSDEEILNRINWKDYPTLAKIDASRKGEGSTVYLNEPIGYDQDAVYGVLWAARNPEEATGDAETDAVLGTLGYGSPYRRDEQKAARLNPASEQYNPYLVGSTLDSQMQRYGVNGFDQQWLDNNLQYRGTDDYAKIYKAEKNTQEAETQLEALKGDLEAALSGGAAPDQVFTGELLEDYGRLQALQEGLNKGTPVELTRSVAFDLPGMEEAYRQAYAKRYGDQTDSEYAGTIAAATGAQAYTSAAQGKVDEAAGQRQRQYAEAVQESGTPGERASLGATGTAGYGNSRNQIEISIQTGNAGAEGARKSKQLTASQKAVKDFFSAREEQDQIAGEPAYSKELQELIDYTGANPADEQFSLKTLQALTAAGDDPEAQRLLQIHDRLMEEQYAQTDLSSQREEADARLQAAQDELKEAYGDDTPEYRAQLETLNYVYQYRDARKPDFSAYDLVSVLEKNAAGTEGNAVQQTAETAKALNRQKLAALEDALGKADQYGVPGNYIANMETEKAELERQNRLIDSHSLRRDANYQAAVSAFDESDLSTDFWHMKGGSDDEVIGAIKDPEAARKYMQSPLNTSTAGWSGMALTRTSPDLYYAAEMTDEERNNFKYLYAVSGREAAMTYYGDLRENLQARYAEAETGAAEKLGESVPVLGSAVSILGSMSQLEGTLYTAYMALTGQQADPNSMFFSANRMAGGIRQGAKERGDELTGGNETAQKIFHFLYDGLVSSGDSLMTAGAGGLTGIKNAGLYLMSATAASNAMQEALLKGADSWKAVCAGMAAGASEYVTEKIPFDAITELYHAGSTGGKIMKLLADNIIGEGLGEGLSEYLGAAGDYLVMGEDSDFAESVRQYREDGMSEEDAIRQTARELTQQALYATLEGTFSGVVSSGASYAAGKLAARHGQQSGQTGAQEAAGMQTETPSETADVAAQTAESVPAVQTEGQNQNGPNEAPKGADGVELVIRDADGNPVQQSGPQDTAAENALNVLYAAQQNGVGAVQQIMSADAALRSLGAENEAATAAAKRMVEENALERTARILEAAPDRQKAAQAVTMALLSPNSETAAVFADLNGPLTAEDVNGLTQMYELDRLDDGAMSAYEAAMEESQLADETLGALSQMDTGRTDSARESIHTAQRTARQAQTQLAQANAALEGAKNALDNARQARAQSLTPENLQAESKALAQYAKARDARTAAANQYQTQMQALKDAKGKLTEVQTEALNQARTVALEQQAMRQEIKKVDYAVQRQNVDANIQQVAQMGSVATLNGDEFSINSENIKQDVADYFDSIGGVVSNPILGDVALTKKGAKTSVSHGMGPKKAIAFAAVPAVIENGKILDVQQNWKNRQYDTFVLAAPVTITSGKYAGQYVEGVIIKRSAQDQSFYLHEVLLMDENSGRVTPIVPGSLNPKADATPSDAYMPATNNSVLQNAADVKQTAVRANEEGAQAPTNPRGQLENQAVVHGDAKAPSLNNILQKVIDVKQGKNVDKNRAESWSDSTRLYLPIAPDPLGSANSIPQGAGTVNTSIADSTGNIPGSDTTAQSTVPAANAQENGQTGGNGAGMNPRGAQTENGTPRMGQSQFATKTGQNTDVLTDETKQKLREAPFYQKLNQKESVERAISKVEREGYTARRDRMLTGITDILTPDGQTEAYVLSQIAKENGDAEGQAAIAFRVKESGTFLAQSLAMRRLYTEMSPEAKVSYVQKLVDQINDQYESKGKDTRVTLPGWVEQAVMEAGDDQTRLSNVLDQAYREIAQQMPYTVGDTLRTWRFLSMLGNPLTHIKNMLANAAFMPYVSVKNRLAAGMEAGVAQVQKLAGRETFERSKSFAPLKKEYRDFAKEICKQSEALLSDNEKANAANGKSKVDKYRQKAPALIDWLSKKNADLLGGEDLIAKNHYFKYALASYLQANKADLSNVSDTLLANATQYAVNEAYKNTFNNVNEFAKGLTKLERKLANSANPVARGAGILLEGTVPFKNTPANIVSRGVEYSPAGLVNAIFLNYGKLKRGVDYQGNPFTMQNYLDGLASGLTGTAAVAMGALLASVGVLDLGDDEDDEVRGRNKNSVNLPGTDINLGIDWSGVAAMPLLMGAQLYNRWSEKNGEPLSLTDFWNGVKGIADPVMDLSMVQGLTALLDTAAYSDNAPGTMAAKMATSYLGQFTPTVLGAITRTFFDDTRRTAYTDKNKDLSPETQYLLQSMRNKIPGLSKEGMAYLDAWGNEQKTDSLLERFLTNFIIPGYAKKIRTDDEVTEALLEMYDEYGDAKYLPTKAKKYFTADGERYDLTQAEYTQYAKERGSIAHELLGGLMQDESYRAAAPEFQLDAITDVWKYASQTAAYNVNDGFKRESWVTSTRDPQETILEKMADRIQTAGREKFKASFFDAFDAGDVRSMKMCAAGLTETGYQLSSLRTACKNQYQARYKEMYEAGDIDGMREMREMLLAADIGFKVTDFNKWLKDGKK